MLMAILWALQAKNGSMVQHLTLCTVAVGHTVGVAKSSRNGQQTACGDQFGVLQRAYAPRPVDLATYTTSCSGRVVAPARAFSYCAVAPAPLAAPLQQSAVGSAAPGQHAHWPLISSGSPQLAPAGSMAKPQSSVPPRLQQRVVLLVMMTIACACAFAWRQQHQAAAASAAAPGAAAGAQGVRLFVGVLSRADNAPARQAVRDTWGSDPRLARVMFVVLLPHTQQQRTALRAEASAHQDIFLTTSAHEGYYNITHASLDVFRAAAVLGAAITHVMKTDDDVYVRVPRLLAELGALPREWLYAGWPMDPISPIRGPPDMWHAVPRSNWPIDRLVRMGYGWGYVLSRDLATRVGAGAAYDIMPPDNLLIIEDLAVAYIVDAIKRREHVEVAYKTVTMTDKGCRPGDVLTHINTTANPRQAGTPAALAARRKVVHQVMRCMHARGGQCCAMDDPAPS